VFLVVMETAPQREIVEVGFAAEDPVVQVVDLTPRRGKVAPGFTAAAVAGDERFVLSLGRIADGAAEVEDM
jgi:hypothetical protein